LNRKTATLGLQTGTVLDKSHAINEEYQPIK